MQTHEGVPDVVCRLPAKNEVIKGNQTQVLMGPSILIVHIDDVL